MGLDERIPGNKLQEECLVYMYVYLSLDNHAIWVMVGVCLCQYQRMDNYVRIIIG